MQYLRCGNFWKNIGKDRWHGIHRPRKGVRYSASSRSLDKGVPEKYIRIAQDMCEGARTIRVGLTDKIPVVVGLHHGSSPSPYRFAMIMDMLACGINNLYRVHAIFC